MPNHTITKFVAIGAMNTVLGTALMFCLYNLAGCSYWLSTFANYFLCSIISFILNKRFTFQNTDSIRKTAPKFALNILLCYLLAYGIAQPLALQCFSGLSLTARENIAMILGMCLFTALNYAGQRFFAFK